MKAPKVPLQGWEFQAGYRTHFLVCAPTGANVQMDRTIEGVTLQALGGGVALQARRLYPQLAP